MAQAKRLEVVGYFDCPGGGQVVVRNNVAYVGHVIPPDGTTIIDVADPARPRELARIAVPAGKDARGLPLGLQIIGRPFDEETLFAAARVVERSAATDFSPKQWW